MSRTSALFLVTVVTVLLSSSVVLGAVDEEVDGPLTTAFGIDAEAEASPTAPEATPPEAESTPAAEAAAPIEGPTVVMLPDSWMPQPMGVPDEFAETENPADYSENVLTVAAGTTVTWVNADAGQIHTTTAVDGSFDSGFLLEGETWSQAFETPGDFEYFCVPHPWMRARVIVEP